MKCLLKRVLPFAFTMVFGLWLANYISSSRPLAEKSAGESPRQRIVSVKIMRVPDIINPAASCLSPNGFSTTIRLEALLGADGTVSEIKPVLMLPYGVGEESLTPEERQQVSPFILDGKFVESLPYGLAEAAIDAARRIEFIPATKDGKPISVRITINSQFSYTPSPHSFCASCPNAEITIIEGGVIRWRTMFMTRAERERDCPAIPEGFKKASTKAERRLR